MNATENGIRGDRLKSLRESQGITQRDLAGALEIGEKEIWRYENEPSNPTAAKLTRIAAFFNVSVDYLLGLTDKPSAYSGNDLSIQELAALSAWRRGDKLKAIRTIADE